MCDVQNCEQSQNSTIFHSPLDQSQLAKWKSRLKIESDVFFVCSAHFDEKYITSNYTLTSTAEPTLFLGEDKDYQCQSCMTEIKDNARRKTLINEEYQNFFLQLIGMELYDGYICSACVNSLMSFKRFRSNIRATHRKYRGVKVQKHPVTTTVKVKEEAMNTEFLITEIKTEPEEFYNNYLDEDVIQFQPAPTNFVMSPPIRKPLLKFPLPSEAPQQTLPPVQGFKCQYCDNRFIEKAFVLAHIKQRHTFRCPHCPCSFPYKISLVKHQMATHGPSEVQEPRNVKRNFSNFRHECHVCKLKFIDEKSLANHITVKHEAKKKAAISFEQLGRKLKLGSQIVLKPVKASQISVRTNPNHPQKYERFSWPEPIPIRKLPTLNPMQNISELVNKIRKPGLVVKFDGPLIDRQESDPNGIPCLDCGLLLLPDRLLNHRREFHDKTFTSSLYLCDLCGLVVRGKQSLMTHMKLEHLPVASHKCDFCHALYCDRFTLIKHLNKMHSEGKRFICHFCELEFKSNEQMSDHRKVHYDYRDRRRVDNTKKTSSRTKKI